MMAAIAVIADAMHTLKMITMINTASYYR
jgi:hypothetical protein